MTDNDLEKLSNVDDSKDDAPSTKTPDRAKDDAVEDDAKGVEPPQSNEGRLSGRSDDSKPEKDHDK